MLDLEGKIFAVNVLICGFGFDREMSTNFAWVTSDSAVVGSVLVWVLLVSWVGFGCPCVACSSWGEMSCLGGCR